MGNILALLSVLTVSFFLNFRAGERGFFAFDQSIVFDGGYRILSGQIPYKDFIVPVGPVAFWLQAIFFKILGTSYFSYIFAAAFYNVLSTASAIIIVRLLFPSRRLLSYASGILTAIWFQAPFGTPWVDQVAFCFSFLAVATLLFTQLSQKSAKTVNGLLLSLSGCFACLSVLTKQNAGLYILPLYFLLLVAAGLPELKSTFYSCIVFASGFIVTILSFSLWLWLKSDVKIYWQHVINIPYSLGVYRFSEIFHCAQLHMLPAGINLIFIFVLLSAIRFLIVGSDTYKKDYHSSKRHMLSSLLCIYAILFQYLFIRTTMNQAENCIPFIGIIFAIGAACQSDLYPKSMIINGRIIKFASSAVILLALFYASALGIRVSLSRKVQEFVNSDFPGYFSINKLKALRWGRPTAVGGVDVMQDDIVSLFKYLKEKNNNFFIFPNFTFFYGLLNVPSPQPILWFHRGLTYHVIYDKNLDKWVVDDLKRNTVNTIIIENAPPYNYYLLNDFPLLKSYLNDNFIKAKQLGIFNIYEKTSPRILWRPGPGSRFSFYGGRHRQ